jgi:hypothetical protein
MLAINLTIKVSISSFISSTLYPANFIDFQILYKDLFENPFISFTFDSSGSLKLGFCLFNE